MTDRPLLLVTVGSDHHPYDRLVGWVDRWLADGGRDRVDCVAQYGTARRPAHAESYDFMAHDRLLELMRQSTALITQGGPMGIVEARRSGVVPIAVPRRRALGEVVDDHQRAFCRQLAEEGDLLLAEDEPSLRVALERVLANPGAYRIPADTMSCAVLDTVARFDSLVAALDKPRHWCFRRRPRIRVLG